MRAKDYFQSVRDAERRIKMLNKRREHYRENACMIAGMSETHIRSVGSRSRTESAALALIDVEEQLSREAEKYAALIADAEALIVKIEKPRYREVLQLRYLCGLSWRSISDELRYDDPKSVFRVHGWALAAAQKLLDAM